MSIVTQEELRVRVADRLGIRAEGQGIGAADAAIIDQALEDAFALLKGDGLVTGNLDGLRADMRTAFVWMASALAARGLAAPQVDAHEARFPTAFSELRRLGRKRPANNRPVRQGGGQWS